MSKVNITKFLAKLDEVNIEYANVLQARIDRACQLTGWRFDCGFGDWFFTQPMRVKKWGVPEVIDRDNRVGPTQIKRLAAHISAIEKVQPDFASNYLKNSPRTKKDRLG